MSEQQQKLPFNDNNNNNNTNKHKKKVIYCDYVKKSYHIFKEEKMRTMITTATATDLDEAIVAAAAGDLLNVSGRKFGRNPSKSIWSYNPEVDYTIKARLIKKRSKSCKSSFRFRSANQQASSSSSSCVSQIPQPYRNRFFDDAKTNLLYNRNPAESSTSSRLLFPNYFLTQLCATSQDACKYNRQANTRRIRRSSSSKQSNFDKKIRKFSQMRHNNNNISLYQVFILTIYNLEFYLSF